MIKKCLTLLSFSVCLLIPSVAQAKDFSGIYVLKTQFRGNNECLEGNEAGSPVHGGAAFMDNCQNVTGQKWKFEPANNGYYRMKTLFRGNGECLEGNEAGSPVHNGAAFMDKCQNVSGQLWKIEPAGNGMYRLKTMFRGNDECLEGNQASSPVKNGAAFMDKCQNVSGQFWKLVKQGNEQSAKYNAAEDFSIKNDNPNGVWSYLGKRSAQGSLERLDRPGQGSFESRRSSVSYWNFANATGVNQYHAVFANLNQTPAQMSVGLRLAPGAMVIHPGNGNDLATVLRFTAPRNGNYKFNAQFTKIDEQPGRVQIKVQKGSSTLKSKVFQKVREKGSFNETVSLKASEYIDFVVTDGGDSFANDSVQVSVEVESN